MVSDDSNEEIGIYRVQHTVRLNGAWLIGISDLIFVDGVPTVVLGKLRRESETYAEIP